VQRNSFGNEIMLENHHSLPQKHLPVSNAVLRDLQCVRTLARKQSTGRVTVVFVVKLSLLKNVLNFVHF